MSSNEKVSQMILDIAAQFIELVSTEEERQIHLDMACKAWNLSILPQSKQNTEFSKYLNKMKAIINNKETMEYFKKDIEGLIKAKIELYPNEKNPILSATLRNVDSNSYQVTASFSKQNILH